ncbi:unnamed protein product [Vicia faba]|uniref:Major facilitator superfamily (MFS) profile domain-containing protein n=1 Tax=Vicia faba TaxID=3906 RepID=A0AAV1AHL7_VICFA|nr:unnamed protein product [Vicia faba]
MKGVVLVAIAASIGNFLQGWDNATIAGSILYIKKDLALQTTMEGLVVAMSLIGATVITTCSGPISDWLGRRPMLIISSVLYFLGSLVMLWSPNVYVLCLARLLDGFGIGLAVTLVSVYISETAPSDIRGSLNTLPQFSGSGGMFLSYCMVFVMSLSASPSWRVMLGVLAIPSLFFFILTLFFLPESPRWLVSKGKMLEAKKVLQRLRGQEDVSGEMALLVEGLGIGGDASIEEYILMIFCKPKKLILFLLTPKLLSLSLCTIRVGSRYLDHLIVERKYGEAASLCPKLLVKLTIFTIWVFHFAHLRQLPVLVPYMPTENPRLRDTAYELALVALVTNSSFHKDLLSTVKSWPSVIYSAPPVISAIEPQLNTSSMTDLLKEALAELYVIDGQYEKAYSLYADLMKPEVFDFIDKHNLHDAIHMPLLHHMQSHFTKLFY